MAYGKSLELRRIMPPLPVLIEGSEQPHTPRRDRRHYVMDFRTGKMGNTPKDALRPGLNVPYVKPTE